MGDDILQVPSYMGITINHKDPDMGIIITRWQFQICFIFTPNPGEDEPNLTCAYFFRWVVKNHQLEIGYLCCETHVIFG